jgi:hypothetical protein
VKSNKIIIPSLFFIGILFSFFFKSSLFIYFVLCLYVYLLTSNFRNLSTLILLTYIFSHLVFSLPFFLYNKSISFWPDFQNTEYIRKVFFLDSIFIYTLSISLGFSKNGAQLCRTKFLNTIALPSPLFFFFFSFLIFLFIFFGVSDSNLINGQAYGFESKSTLNEYSILLFLMLVVTRNEKSFLQSMVFYLIIFYFIAKNILSGGRIEVFQLLLLFLYVYLIIPRKISVSNFFFLSIPVLFIFLIVGLVRSNPLILNDLDLYYFLSSSYNSLIVDMDYYNSTQGDVIQSSARILGLVESGVLNFFQRVFGFPLYIFSSVIPASILPEYSNLSVFEQNRFQSGGGGLASVYFYTWLGYSGPIILGFWVGRVIGFMNNTKNKFLMIYSILVFVTVPRWYSYNPIFLVKFCVYGCIIYWVLNLVLKKVDVDTANKFL